MRIRSNILLLFVVMSLLLAPSKAEATYCDFELTPQITATQTIYNYTMNASNASVIDNQTYTTLTYNISVFNRLASGQYIANYSINNTNNLTQSITNAYLTMICNSTKNFFIINASNYTTLTKPNETVNFNFYISPVSFGKYVINSWGLYAINETNINISEPYYYNITRTTPDIERGTYRQVFQITNGKESQYIYYEINNTGLLRTKVLKSDIPEKVTFGHRFDMSFVTDNVDEINVDMLKDGGRVAGFGLERKSPYLFEGGTVPKDIIDTFRVKIRNNYTETATDYDVETILLDIPQDNVVLPSLLLNYTSYIKLVDFGTDIQIPIEINGEIVHINESDNTTQVAKAEFYFANELGTANPTSAKQIFIYINPQSVERGKINVNLTSPAFPDRHFSIFFLGGSFNNNPIMDINYYGKPTHCVIKQGGEMLFNYTCTFELPSDYDIKNLQNNEVSIMKSGFDMTLGAKEDMIKKDKRNYYMLLGFNIIVLLGLVGYYVATRTRFRLGV